jgi:hypothetical protein
LKSSGKIFNKTWSKEEFFFLLALAHPGNSCQSGYLAMNLSMVRLVA